MITIIDHDIGNVSAIKNMLSHLGFNSTITKNKNDVKKASRIILPGNGSFDSCMKNLRGTGLIPLLENKIFEQNTPLLGICVGAQMLGLGSEEGNEQGLGWIDMTVKKFPKKINFPVPNMGWRDVVFKKKHRIINTNQTNQRFYFVHSFYMKPKNQSNVLITSHYDFTFAAAVIKKNIIGVQFHPEKSHHFGKLFLKGFAEAI